MEKYTLSQKFSIADENGYEKKLVDMRIYISEEGMSKQQIMNMFNTIACGYVRLLAEECNVYDDPFGNMEDQNGNCSGEDDIREGWYL